MTHGTLHNSQTSYFEFSSIDHRPKNHDPPSQLRNSPNLCLITIDLMPWVSSGSSISA